MPVDKGEQAQPEEKASAEVIEHLKPNDSFFVSTSEFVAPAIPISYVKAKGSYLLFRQPDISTTLIPEMSLWFKVSVFSLRSEITFRGEIYKLYGDGQTTYPCMIVKTAPTMTVTPVKMDEGVLEMNLPMTWRKTASLKKGICRRLTLKGGIFETTEENISAHDKLWVQITMGDSMTDDLQITIDRLTPIQESGNLLGNKVEFSFVGLNPLQETNLQASILKLKENQKT